MEKGASKSSDSLDNVTASQNEKKKFLSFLFSFSFSYFFFFLSFHFLYFDGIY